MAGHPGGLAEQFGADQRLCGLEGGAGGKVGGQWGQPLRIQYRNGDDLERQLCGPEGVTAWGSPGAELCALKIHMCWSDPMCLTFAGSLQIIRVNEIIGWLQSHRTDFLIRRGGQDTDTHRGTAV